MATTAALTPEHSKIKDLARRAWKFWETRSVVVSSIATVFDLGTGLLLLKVFKLEYRASAMGGVAVGSVVTFFASRYIAFRTKDPKLAKPAVKFILTAVALMVIHGQVVVMLRDHFQLNFVFAKVIADLLVFVVGGMVAFRFFVFKKGKRGEQT